MSLPPTNVVCCTNPFLQDAFSFGFLSTSRVDARVPGLGHGELRVVRLHGAQHVQRLVDLALLDGQLAIGHQDLHFLQRERERSCVAVAKNAAVAVATLALDWHYGGVGGGGGGGRGGGG